MAIAKIFFRYFRCFLWCVLSWNAWAAPAVEIKQTHFRLELPPYVDVLEDADGDIAFQHIQQGKYEHQFTPAPLTELFFGYTRSVYWLRFQVENQLDVNAPLILEITPADIDYIEIFALDDRRQDVLFYKLSGSAVDFDHRDYDHPLYYFDLLVPASEARTYYVRLESNKSINATLRLASPREHFFFAGMRDWWQGFLFGSLCLLALLHFSMGALFHYKGFVYCGFWMLSVLLIQGSWNGYFIQFTHADAELLDRQLMNSVYLSAIFGLLFVRSFLDTHHRTPRAHRVLTFFMMIALMGVPCAWLFSPVFNSVLVAIITISVVFFMFGLGIYNFLDGYEPARYFLFARTITTVMILVVLFADYGLLPDAFVNTYGLSAAIVLEGSVFLFAMIKYRRRSKQFLEPVKALAAFKGETTTGVPVSVFCHELRTPIGGVLGMTELLLETPLSQQQRAQAESIQSSGRILLDVVNKMSDLSSIERGELVLRDGTFEMLGLVELCIEAIRPVSEQRRIELLYQVDDNVGGWMQGDRDRLQQILIHLITFNMRHLESGEVLLTVRSMPSDAIRFEVVAGRQVLNSPAPEINEDEKTAMPLAGNLNLTMARQFIELMGGQLVIAERRDRVEMSFQLLLRRVSDHDAPETLDHLLRGKSILIVDDNETCCQIVQQQAVRWGMEAISALNGKIALAELRSRAGAQRHFDLLLIDYDMPGMNGLELLEQMERERHNLNLEQTLVLVLTGANKMPPQLMDQRLRVSRFLYKPLSGKSLKMVLIDALREQ